MVVVFLSSFFTLDIKVGCSLKTVAGRKRLLIQTNYDDSDDQMLIIDNDDDTDDDNDDDTDDNDDDGDDHDDDLNNDDFTWPGQAGSPWF